jgi:polar amino acid transport system substrate-binding protein
MCAEDKIVLVTVSETPNKNKRADEIIIKEIFKEMGKKVEIKYFPWNRCLEMVENKRADGIFCLKKTEEREKYMIFPKEWITESEWVFFYKKDRNISYESEESLKGKIVAATSGYAYGDKFWKNTEFKINEGYDDIVNMNSVINGRVDFFICNKEDGIKILKQLNNEDVIYSKKVYMSYPLYLAFSIKEENKLLAEIFSAKLLEIKRTGKYKMKF